ncbi:CdaR family protein [Anaeromicropila herbilytica]|uniref:YbbR domain-containing protein n=1 Tax=Anaeromicropila herbilytica TaxID=2785025 RepID=A0A7R7IBL8_9FIRM|nr:CdaR family protein [Anaeromicropila herbilytica]BCN29778.1 hypothetical protein bsdtb5_10730 [Anaeromicropila herbilytica]
MKEKLTKNLGMKILSFAIALVCWIVIINIDDPVITRTFPGIPVDIINEDSINSLNQVYEVKEGDVVNVTIKGKKSVIDSLTTADIKAEADLSKLSKVNAVPIRAYITKQIDGAIELSLGRVDTLRVSLEDVAKKQFQVTVEQKGEVQDGYSVGTIRVKPNLIKVSGAKSKISSIEEVRVTLDVSNASGKIDEYLEPKVYDRNGYQIDSSNLKFSSNAVKVTADLLETKTIPLLINVSGKPANGYKYISIDYEPKKITIAGKQKYLDDMKYLAIKLDISKASENIEEEVNLEDYLPDGIKIAGDKQTAMVNITIDKLVKKSISLNVNDLEVRNIPSNMSFSYIKKGMLSLRVQGVSKDLDNLVISKLNPYIDLKGLKKGTYTVEVKFNAPDNIVILSKIMVKIQLVDEDKTSSSSDNKNDSTSDTNIEDTPSPSPSPTQSSESSKDKSDGNDLNQQETPSASDSNIESDNSNNESKSNTSSNN